MRALSSGYTLSGRVTVRMFSSSPPVSQPVQQQPQAQPVIQTSSVPVSPAPVMQTEENKNPEEVMELLKKLFEMKEAGILTDDEFTAKKQEMLKKM